MGPCRINLVRDVRDEELRYAMRGGKGFAPASRLRMELLQARENGWELRYGFERGEAELFDCVTVL